MSRAARAVAVAASAALAGAAAPPPGASSCSGCHAGPGRAAIPSIHGRPAAELAGALRAFRAGERPASVMDRIARGFSDGEMDAIAAWIATQR